jgi:hypothetical protein
MATPLSKESIVALVRATNDPTLLRQISQTVAGRLTDLGAAQGQGDQGGAAGGADAGHLLHHNVMPH